jgi:hypothetical protein
MKIWFHNSYMDNNPPTINHHYSPLTPSTWSKPPTLGSPASGLLLLLDRDGRSIVEFLGGWNRNHNELGSTDKKNIPNWGCG